MVKSHYIQVQSLCFFLTLYQFSSGATFDIIFMFFVTLQSEYAHPICKAILGQLSCIWSQGGKAQRD